MFTQCTECKKLHQITVENLRRYRGMHVCKRCSTRFDALVLLSESLPDASGSGAVNVKKSPLQTRQQAAASLNWGAAWFAGMLLLFFQAFHFERDYFIHNEQLRPWLEKTCEMFNCRLPAYRNPNDFYVLHSRFSPVSKESYRLLAVFANQSAYPQPYPAIRMILQEFSGKSFAQRIFFPEEYLPKLSQYSLMASGEQFKIDLHISKPETPIGGFTIDLI